MFTSEQQAEIERLVEARVRAALDQYRAELAGDAPELDEVVLEPGKVPPYAQDIQRDTDTLGGTHTFPPGGTDPDAPITYDPVPDPPMDPEDPTVPSPDPDDPEPYEGQTPEDGYTMRPRMLWVLRKALAVDVAADETLVLGQWLKSKRLVMCSEEIEYEPTVPHVMEESQA